LRHDDPVSARARKGRRPGPGRPVDLAKREAILTSTRELLQQRGPAVTLEEVAEAAGVSRQTIYNNWTSKEQLIDEVIGSCVDELMTPLRTAAEDASVEETLTALATAYLNMLINAATHALLRVVLSSREQYGPSFYAAGPRRTQRYLADYLRRQAARGVLEMEDPDLAAEHFIGMLKGNYFLKVMLHGPNAIEPEGHMQRITTSVATFLRAYGRRR